MNKLIIVFFCLASGISIHAQISSPGMGANPGSWEAIAIRQGLDSSNLKQSVTYVGMGRIGNPNGYNPFQKSGIFVINEEFYNQFHKHWQYTAALSYRRQNDYSDIAPYEQVNPIITQEFRLYGRFSYILKTSRIRLVATYRQEFRKFFTPEFRNSSEDLQFRSRLRAQLTINLDHKKIYRLVMSAEALFSITKNNFPQSWTNFAYHESRFCFYFAYAPKHKPFIINIGYMNDLLGTGSAVKGGNYLVGDIIFENPFGNVKGKKSQR